MVSLNARPYCSGFIFFIFDQTYSNFDSILIFQIYSSFVLHSANLTSPDHGFKPETSFETKLCS